MWGAVNMAFQSTLCTIISNCTYLNSISLLERCNSDWSNVLKDLKGDERIKEEKELQKMADGSDGYVELILDAGEHVARLQTKSKIISREQEKEQAKATGDVDKAGMNHENVRVDNLKVNLPKLHLPFFDGNIQYWPEFWDIFKSTIHEQNILLFIY